MLDVRKNPSNGPLSRRTTLACCTRCGRTSFLWWTSIIIIPSLAFSAQSSGFSANGAVRRLLGALWVATYLAHAVHHPVFRVLSTEPHLFTNLAYEGCWVHPAWLVYNFALRTFTIPFFGVVSAELRLSPKLAVQRSLAALRVATSLAHDVQHPVFRVLSAELPPFGQHCCVTSMAT